MSSVTSQRGEPKLQAPVQKRGRGRPPKYASEEERLTARRAQILRSVKQHRARIRAEPPSNTGAKAEARTTKQSPSVVSDAAKESASPTDESGVDVQTPTAVIRSPKDASAFDHFNRMPPELALMQASSLIDSLHGVWITCTKGDESWWPSVPMIQLTNGAPTRQLVASARIAAFASNVGVSRGDEGLIRLGSIAYHQTLRDMRQYMMAPFLQTPNYSIALVMVAYSLISYEFSTCLHSPESLPTSPMWAVHGEASNHIARQAGPEAFRSPLGRRVLIGLLPQTCMARMGMRQRVNWDGPEWLGVLQGTVWPSYRDSIWPMVIHIPGYMQRLDIYDVDLAASSPGSISLTETLLTLSNEVRALDAKLEMWLEGFKATQGALADTNLYWCSTAEGPIWNIFSPHIQFATITIAEVMMLYWAFKLNLSALIYDIEKRMNENPIIQQQRRLPTPPLHQDEAPLPPQHYAYLICRTAHYWLTQSDPSPSTNTIYNCCSFPLRVAWRVWAKGGRKYEEEYNCTAKISKQLRESSYAGKMGEYVITFAYAPPPKLFDGEEELLKAEREVSKDPREPVTMMQRIVKATYNLW